jgi:hypothetical protein
MVRDMNAIPTGTGAEREFCISGRMMTKMAESY